MKTHVFVVLIFLLSLTSGCATQVGLTYVTVPPGAYISYTKNGQQHGISPLRLIYNWDPRFVKNGCLQTAGITAKWVSGASAISPDLITKYFRINIYKIAAKASSLKFMGLTNFFSL